MKNITIRVKLILLFILIKIIPLLIISFIAYQGVLNLEKYLNNSTRYLFNENKEIILNTANSSIKDSIKNLDKKSQLALERLSYELANKIADFLYERDNDLLFLSKLDLNKNILENFYQSKQKEIIIHDKYIYNDVTNKWISTKKQTIIENTKDKAELKDNEKEFNYTNPIKLEKKSIPIYKEISFFDLKGKEKIKVSQINNKLLDISNKKNTYINSETYFNEISNLKNGEIYVSDVIGEYVGTKIIGDFTKEKAAKANIAFEPEKYAYAGKENPNGKKFEGIIRFITPVFKNNKKIGYISLALDHEHIMQFTDTSNPTEENAIQNISDASKGNYAFMWNYEGKNISHPRDFFIVGYDKNSGEEVMPWLSADVAKKYKESNLPINDFLKNYPTFEEQSLSKKPNISQLLKDGNVALDCRYLNFAPQCSGWMQVTKNGGYGSFIIYWSNVWKLTTAATIPYYSGKYKNSKRGFGFVTIGANVDEFHSAANETKKNITYILDNQTKKMKNILDENRDEVDFFISSLINELSIITVIMVILIIGIAIWMSNYITSKINNLLKGTKKFANNEFDYKIKITSKDEIGNLEQSFNDMTTKIKNLIDKQTELNEHLEEKVSIKTQELQNMNQQLENQVKIRTQSLQDALIQAQNADRVKTTFLANMSHEIRTPLNSIIGFSQILTQEVKLSTINRKYASIIESSAKSLLNIINDILDISKIESGNFDISLNKTNLFEIGKDVFELFNNKALEKKIKLSLNIDKNIPPCILTDGVRIRQVLSNFLSNAIKFTPQFGTINFDINVISTNKDKVNIRFVVKDSGIGIPEDKLEEIFKPFIQVNNESNRSYEGTGLGLSICTHIVDLLNSKIEVDSSIDKGTTFWFDLELNTCLNDNCHTNNDDFPTDIRFKGNVLVAEDNLDNQQLISYLLNNFGLKSTIVSNGEEAIKKYKSEIFDLILMDINMPVVDGITAFKQIREYEKQNNLKNIPISALTANTIVGDKEKFLDLGMDYYLSKPIEINELKKLFIKYLVKVDECFLKNDEVLNTEKISLNSISTRLGLPEEITLKIVDKFKEKIFEDLEELKSFIEEENSEQIKYKAHYIKNSCLNVNLTFAISILQEIESNCENEKDYLISKYNLLYDSITNSIN